MNTELQANSTLLEQAAALLESESDPIANAANLSALIFHNVEDLNWVGFYFLRQDELVLGPFQGQLACTRIALGKGVCGSAYAQREALRVDDVHSFEGHIACDVASESEVVVPFYTEGLSGVLDVDSPKKARFDDATYELLVALAGLYEQALHKA